MFEAENIDSCIHFAGLKAVGESVSKPLEYYSNNISGSLVLFDEMRNHNVKNIIFIKDMDKYMEYIVKPNFREVGKLFGPKVNMFAETLKTLSHDEISKLRNEEIEIVFDGNTIKVTPNMVDINVKVKEGYCSSNNGKTFVILNTELTDELILEGIARELIRKIQSMRKEMDLVITDRINVYYNGPEKLEETLLKHSDFIKNETLTRLITKDENLKECFDINDINVYLKIEKA